MGKKNVTFQSDLLSAIFFFDTCESFRPLMGGQAKGKELPSTASDGGGKEGRVLHLRASSLGEWNCWSGRGLDRGFLKFQVQACMG